MNKLKAIIENQDYAFGFAVAIVLAIPFLALLKQEYYYVSNQMLHYRAVVRLTDVSNPTAYMA